MRLAAFLVLVGVGFALWFHSLEFSWLWAIISALVEVVLLYMYLTVTTLDEREDD